MACYDFSHCQNSWQLILGWRICEHRPLKSTSLDTSMLHMKSSKPIKGYMAGTSCNSFFPVCRPFIRRCLSHSYASRLYSSRLQKSERQKASWEWNATGVDQLWPCHVYPAKCQPRLISFIFKYPLDVHSSVLQIHWAFFFGCKIHSMPPGKQQWSGFFP